MNKQLHNYIYRFPRGSFTYPCLNLNGKPPYKFTGGGMYLTTRALIHIYRHVNPPSRTAVNGKNPSEYRFSHNLHLPLRPRSGPCNL